MRQGIRHILHQCMRLLYERTIFVLTLGLCVGVGAMLWHVAHVQESLIVSIAVRDAALYTEALAEFRTLYTSEVVQTVRQHGIEVTHDYSTRRGAIPLPATLSMLLGQRIGAHASGVQVRLYSPYPFPWRQQEGGLQDTFAKEAWGALQHRPHAPFYRFEAVQGRRSLRYATADRLRPSCVHCHNTHGASPKTNWHVGDVRGVLEIVLPVDTAVAQTRTGLQGTLALLVGISALGLSGLALVIGRLRRSSVTLAQQAVELHSEISERTRAEKALRASEEGTRAIIDTALDAVITMDAAGVVTEWNPQAEAIFGWSRQDIGGQSLAAAIIPPRYRQAHQRGMQRFLTTGDGPIVNTRIEITALHRDGHEFPIELAVTPVRADGTVVFSAFVRDITERKRAEVQLQQALTVSEAHRQELERFNRFAVGRELRMIELKHQVNALLLAQGKPPRYIIDHPEEEHV